MYISETFLLSNGLPPSPFSLFFSRMFPSGLQKTECYFTFYKWLPLLYSLFLALPCAFDIILTSANSVTWNFFQNRRIKKRQFWVQFNSWLFCLVRNYFPQRSEIILNPSNVKLFRKQCWEMYWWKWVYFWHWLSPVLNSEMVQGILCISAHRQLLQKQFHWLQ